MGVTKGIANLPYELRKRVHNNYDQRIDNAEVIFVGKIDRFDQYYGQQLCGREALLDNLLEAALCTKFTTNPLESECKSDVFVNNVVRGAIVWIRTRKQRQQSGDEI